MDPILDDAFLLLIIGRRSSGKTRLLSDLLSIVYRKRFDLIVVMSPSAASDPSFRLHPQGVCLFNKISAHVIKELTKYVEEQQIRALLVLDDISHSCREDKKITEMVDTIAFNGRHIGKGLSLIVLQQKITQASPDCRSQADVILLFKEENSRCRNLLSAEYGGKSNSELMQIYDQATKYPRSFLVIRNRYGILEFYSSHE